MTPAPPQALADPPFARRVVDWQRGHGRRGLPWQGTRDPYRVWLSEIMLQQTQVATVLGYYGRFLERFPDVRALAAAPLDDVLALWSGLGYYGRARNLHRCAVEVATLHGGEFPRTSEALARLPGIGRSTAAAIAAFCFGERAAILDGNVRRVLARLLGFGADLSQAPAERLLWAHAEALLPSPAGAATALPPHVAEIAAAPWHHAGPAATGAGVPAVRDAAPAGGTPASADASARAHDDIAAYTQGLMDLGAAVCTARSPACAACPVAGLCVARREGAPERYPVRTRRTRRTRRESWWLWIECGGRVLLRRQPASGVWAGLWTLPLHDDPAALAADAARLGAPRTEALPPVAHALTHFDWLLRPHRAVLQGEPPDDAAGGGRWFAFAELAAIALPAPLRKLLVPGAAPAGGVGLGDDAGSGGGRTTRR